MSYITKRPEGAPDWIPTAVLCRVRDSASSSWSEDYISNYYPSMSLPFKGARSNWVYAEPIEAWQPSEGEIVAVFDEQQDSFLIGKYVGEYEKRAHCIYISGDLPTCKRDHVARLVYPDGRVIDCACDVEELKRRVGEGNWL